jgi:hypothetical protein
MATIAKSQIIKAKNELLKNPKTGYKKCYFWLSPRGWSNEGYILVVPEIDEGKIRKWLSQKYGDNVNARYMRRTRKQAIADIGFLRNAISLDQNLSINTDYVSSLDLLYTEDFYEELSFDTLALYAMRATLKKIEYDLDKKEW